MYLFIAVHRYKTALTNQSVENAGVAIVKGVNDSNEFFKKIIKQLCMMNTSGRTRQRTNNLRNEVIGDELRQVAKGWCIIAPVERYSGHRYIHRNKKLLQSSMPCFCLFSYDLLIIFFSAIETLICRIEMSLIGSTSFGFAQIQCMIFKIPY